MKEEEELPTPCQPTNGSNSIRTRKCFLKVQEQTKKRVEAYSGMAFFFLSFFLVVVVVVVVVVARVLLLAFTAAAAFECNSKKRRQHIDNNIYYTIAW